MPEFFFKKLGRTEKSKIDDRSTRIQVNWVGSTCINFFSRVRPIVDEIGKVEGILSLFLA